MDRDQLVSRKRDNHSGQDFLSDLPLSIIHCILQRVPIREVVRTCILSRRWRYIWASLPHLVFEQEGDLLEWKDLKLFINKLLFFHKGPIQFRLEYPLDPEDDFDIEHWLLCLSRTEIRGISLGIARFDRMLPRFRVHSRVYSCQKLTHLKLCHCILPPPPPTFKGFSYLRSLFLYVVKVPSFIVEDLVANSPLLEMFTSFNSASWHSSELRISAPNLKCFDLTGDFKEISLYAPLVAEVSVSFDEDGFPDELQISDCNYTKFLGGFTNLERLRGRGYFAKYLSIGIESYDRSLVFHHLKFIDLKWFSFEDKNQLAVMGHLMMGAPNLEVLTISVIPSKYFSEPPYIPYSNFGCAPSFTFNKLRFITMEHLHGLLSEVEIVKYLLKSSPVLEKMDLMFCVKPESDVKSNLISELQSCCRASPNAKIFAHSVGESDV